MANVENGYGAFFVVDFVDNAVVTEADTPALTACQLQATGWPRVNRKLANGVTDSAVAFRGKLRQFLLSMDRLSVMSETGESRCKVGGSVFRALEGHKIVAGGNAPGNRGVRPFDPAGVV
jgi:hypothetical protein